MAQGAQHRFLDDVFGAALFAAGRASESVHVAAETLPMARAMGAAANYGVYFAARGAEALAWLGQWRAARQLIGELLGLDPPPGRRCRPLLTSGLLRFWQGDFDTARAELTLALDGIKPSPHPPPVPTRGKP